MRFFTVLFVSFIVINCTHSQAFQFRVDTLSDVVHPAEFENYISNFAVNVSNEAQTLRWTQKTIFKGSKWSNSQVCDNFLCYTDKVLTKTIDIQSGDSSLLKILFRPNGQDTSGYYTITAQVDGNSTIDDTGHYFFNGNTAGFKKIEEVETVKIYPNPAVDYVQLASKDLIRDIAIYDARGVVVKSISDYNKGLIQVNDLASGPYYMIFTFNNGKLGVSRLTRI